MSWKEMTDGAKIVVDVLDEIVFEALPYAFDEYFLALPIWVIVAVLIIVCAIIVRLSLAPTRRGDFANVGTTMVVNAAGKASRGLFVIGFYGSILTVFVTVILRNI